MKKRQQTAILVKGRKTPPVRSRSAAKTKLTLSVKQSNVDIIKDFATDHNTTVSDLFDVFIESVISSSEQGRLHPTVARLKGIIKDAQGDPDLLERTVKK